MKLYCRLTICALLAVFALPRLAPAQSFEGKIEQREIRVSDYGIYELIDSDEDSEFAATTLFELPMERILELADELGGQAVEVTNLVYYVTGDRMRLESPGGVMPGYMIMDFESGAFQMVIPFQKMYLEITKEDMQELTERYGETDEGRDPVEKPQIRALGMSKQINGMQCDAHEVIKGETVSHVWVSPELKDVVEAFANFVERLEVFKMDEEEEGDLEVFELMKEHGFPVLEQTLTRSEYNVEYQISELISVERGAHPAEMFEVPSDYQRKSFTEMMESFGGGN